ncbi:pyridoxal phosphate-dependent aminotransferase [Fluviispira multicolorata]|uniref:Aminotransferase n=1 Tax=Fluviispira multicolorata TaxID=2654512 RepID=A0A833N594_9BACT|nr:pyridoxal phosphate-dependent aminotransferase [Fluviispira multicolorata]KAB8029942.1 aminotransferase class I/II-fold pyridoxal phosphate-dependent enzyme [Fluviispira multicolorata]
MIEEIKLSIEVLALDRNEYYFEHHPQVLASFHLCNSQNYSRYASNDGHTQMLNSLALLLKIEAENITLAHGAEDALIKALSWLKLKYKTIVVDDFSWTNYIHIAEGLGYQVHKIPTQMSGNSFILNIAGLKNHLNKCEPSVILLTSPNNPTGHSISQNELYSLLKTYPEHFFILDMVYAPFFEQTYFCLMNHENSLFVGSFSKYFGLPGLRVGFAVGLLPKAFKLNLGLQPQAIHICQTVLNHINWYQSNRSEMIQFAQALLEKKYKNIKPFKSDAPFILVQLVRVKSLQKILLSAEEMTFVRPKYLVKDNVPYIRFGLGPAHVCAKIEDYLTFIDKKFDENSF